MVDDGDEDELDELLGEQLALIPRSDLPPIVRVDTPKGSTKDLREYYGWTLDKLEVLRLYLMMYRRVASKGVYIDGFAGPGAGTFRGEVHLGSPLLALSSGAFRDYWLYELDGDTVGALKRRIEEEFPSQAGRVRVRDVDCNVGITDLLASAQVPTDVPIFAFLDQESTQLAWSTVEALARCKEPVDPPERCRTELFILFNTDQVVARLRSRRTRESGSGEAAALDRIMGGRDAWQDLLDSGASPGEYALRYARRIEALGYRHVWPQPVFDPANRQRQYHMIFASDHDAAARFMKWAKKASHAFRDQSFPGWD